jgi:hypothetical protein
MIEREVGSCIWHKNCRGVDVRLMGNCVKCRKEVSMTHGHLAPPLDKHNMVCARCLAR